MRRISIFPISAITFVQLIVLSTTLFAQSPQTTPSIPDSLKSTYHLSWVWPDSMPALLPDFCVDDFNRVCVGDYNGNLYLLNGNGEIVLVFKLSNGYVMNPKIFNQRIYFLQSARYEYIESANIYAIDIYHHDIIWNIGPLNIGNSKVYDYHDSTIWVESRNFRDPEGLYEIKPNGEYKFIPLPEYVWARFLGISHSGKIIEYDYSHEVIYHFSSEMHETNKITLEKNTRLFEDAFGKDDEYYCRNFKGELMAFRNDGRLKWKHVINQYDHNKYVSVLKENKTGDVVYIATGDGIIKALNNLDGSQKWEIRQGDTLSRIDNIAEIGNNTIVVLNSDAQIDIISPDGILIWHHEMYDTGRAEISQIPDSRNIFVMQSGKLYKFSIEDTCYNQSQAEASLPNNQDAAEKEIIEYMLGYIGAEIGGLADILSDPDFSNAKFEITAPIEDIIIYYAMRELENTKESALDWDKPKSVWLTAGGLLFAADDQSKAIKDFDKRTKKDSMKPWSYGEYGFGLKFLNSEFTQAEIIYNHSCGMLCGDGGRMILRRSPSGKWWISRHLESWIS
jgi:outer membrane protein assembly factor BamB